MRPMEIGVCSWSLARPTLEQTLDAVRQLGLSLVQLAVGPVLHGDRELFISQIRASGLEVSATMIGFAGEDYSTLESIAATGGFGYEPAAERRLELAIEAGELTRRLGVQLLTMHVGFIPPEPSSAGYSRMLSRVGTLADALAAMDVELGMETGQETAHDLLRFIERLARPNVKVNFDPANMILYGKGEPIEAVKLLAEHIVHVHCKDAVASEQPGRWGREVPLGSGQVDFERFIDVLRSVGYAGPLVIEREGGNQRMRDIASAIGLLRSIVDSGRGG